MPLDDNCDILIPDFWGNFFLKDNCSRSRINILMWGDYLNLLATIKN